MKSFSALIVVRQGVTHESQTDQIVDKPHEFVVLELSDRGITQNRREVTRNRSVRTARENAAESAHLLGLESSHLQRRCFHACTTKCVSDRLEW